MKIDRNNVLWIVGFVVCGSIAVVLLPGSLKRTAVAVGGLGALAATVLFGDAPRPPRSRWSVLAIGTGAAMALGLLLYLFR